MKECFKCHETLPLSQFYRHPQMADGHLNKCKRCTRRDVQANYANNRDHYRAYDKSRHGPQRRAVTERAKQRYPERYKARVAVHNAIRDKRLIRQPCEVCGSDLVDAHHEDYEKPLQVRWLCRQHHMAEHRFDKPVAA